MERWVRNEVIYDGDVVRLKVGGAELDDGTPVQREVVEHSGGVAVVPLLDDRVVLVRQYRIAIGKDLLEIPAGRLEPNEDPAIRAAAELEEEVGYRAGSMSLLSTFYPSPGFCDQIDYLYLATDLEKTVARPEFDERIEIVTMTLGELRELITTGKETLDAKTLIGVYALFAHLGVAV